MTSKSSAADAPRRRIALLLLILAAFATVFPFLLIGDRGGGMTRMLLAIGAGAVVLGLLALAWPMWASSWRRLPLPVRIVLTLVLVATVMFSMLLVGSLIDAVFL